MKPPRFAYFAPTSVGEALALLREYGTEGKVLAGGQSLIPMLNFRLTAPSCLIDINKIQELEYIRRDGDYVCLGALARHRTVERSPLIRHTVPLLAEAAQFIGHVAIRTRGTIGGSLAHADPAAELPVALAALDAIVTVESVEAGVRESPISDFFVTYMTTVMSPDELLTAVKVPAIAPGIGWAFLEVARRSGDFALVSVAALIAVNQDGVVTDCRIALGGVGPTPVRVTSVEKTLLGQRASQMDLAAAGKAVAAVIEPESDLHASAALRRRLAAELAKRALRVALSRTRGGAAV